MVSVPNPSKWLKKKFNSAVYSAVSKFNYPTSSYGQSPNVEIPEPPYQREIHPRWLYNLRQNSTLINNSIEEKVSQTFRRGFTEWEKEYKAKCPNCKEEFPTLDRFREQLGEYGSELEDDEIDLESDRVCPECEETVQMHTPESDKKQFAEEFFQQANEKTDIQSHLEPTDQNSVGQTFIEVCKELAWDIQSFDDAWMLFEREYTLDPESGVILDYELKGVHRAPPEVMRYSVDEKGNFGNEYWACPKCRSKHEEYKPEREPVECSKCGGYTYPVYAVSLDDPTGDPINYYIRGEFVHASEYEPKKYYGYSPILTLWEEARTLEKMDDWYKDAYEKRRAPRGAMLVRSSNAQSVRAHNQGQMEKLRGDRHYIPTFIDDTDGSGKALEWINLLEDPAEMQHMEMRDWFLERISAKFGVTPVFQKGSPNNSGLSQSLEIVVSNRSADRLRRIFNNTFIPAFIGQLKCEGWTRELRPVEEEDEAAEADVQGKFVQNAKRAIDAGFNVEWTEDDKLKIHPGEPVTEEEREMQQDLQEQQIDQMGDIAEQQGGQPGTPPGQGPRMAQSVTSSTSGYSNVRYGGGERGEEIDILGNLREILEEEEEKMEKSIGDLSWNDIDISEYVRIWVDDPEEVPEECEINLPEGDDNPANYYYEYPINSISVGKADHINKTSEAIDFFWSRSPAGVIKQELQDDYQPYQPPLSCNRTYLESEGITEDEVAEAQVFMGPSGKKFYCSNYKETGTWNEENDPYDEQARVEENEKYNEELPEDQQLRDYEGVFEFETWNDMDMGQYILVNPKDEDGLERFKFDAYEVMGPNSFVIIEDSNGDGATADASKLEDRVEGVIYEVADEQYEKRYENYTVPNEIYDPDRVEDKETMGDEEGGINSSYTRIVTFDNGEKAIYKNYRGSSHEYCLDGDVMAYELSQVLDMGELFPETARVDLKNGYGSAQKMLDNVETFRDAAGDDGNYINEDNPVDEVILSNTEQFGYIGLVDYFTGNRDRHSDNFMVTDSQDIIAIDNGGHPTPREEATDDALWIMYRNLVSSLMEGSDSPKEFDQNITTLFNETKEAMYSRMEYIKDNREEILEMTESFYGPKSPVTTRVKSMLELDDSGNLSMEDSLEDDIDKNEQLLRSINNDALPN